MKHGYLATHVLSLQTALLLVASRHNPKSESVQTILCVAKSLGNVADALRMHSQPDKHEAEQLPDLPDYPKPNGNGKDGGVKIPLSPTPPDKSPPAMNRLDS